MTSSYAVHIELLKSIVGDAIEKFAAMKSEFDSDADEFGMSENFLEAAQPIFQFLYYEYFRVGVSGVNNIPKKGPAILIANHSGTIPYDGVMSHLAAHNEHPSSRRLRFLVDDFVFNIPILKDIITYAGGVKATFDNALKLLNAGHIVMIFPEGVEGIGKTYDERYKLRPFNHTGFMRLTAMTGAPVIPTAIIGAEEIHPLIAKSETLGSFFGLPFVPFTPTFPILGPLGLVPLPSKWSISFGKKFAVGRLKKSDADDDALMMGRTAAVEKKIQNMINAALKKRRSIWI